MITLIEDAISSPDRIIDELTLLSESEKERLLKRASGNPVNYRGEMTIPGLFEEKVKSLSDKPAVVYEGRTLSYRTLHEQSGRIAGRLLLPGYQPILLSRFCLAVLSVSLRQYWEF